MKSIFRIVALLCLLSACAFGTVTVSGTIQDPSGAVVPNSFVRFALVNTGNNQCSANGVSLGAFSTDFYANLSTGAVSGTLYRTDTEISCGGFFTARYNMTIYRKGVPSGPTKCVLVNSDFNVATPIWCTSQPGAPALPAPQFAQTNPVTSQTVVQPLGSKFTVQGDQSVTGNVTAATGTFTGTVTGATGAFTTLTATSVNGEENAAAWPGLDILDSCQAAVTFLQANGGGIVHIPAGNYLNVTHTCAVTSANVSIIGAGSTSTVINYTGTGKAISVGPIVPDMTVQAGKFSGFKIVGGSTANTTGLYIADTTGAGLDDLVIKGFTGTGAKGMWWEAVSYWVERTLVTRVHLDQNTTDLAMSVRAGNPNVSFMYSRILDLRMNVAGSQTGISLTGAYCGHCTLRSTINGNAGASKTFVSLDATSQIDRSEFWIFAEDTGGGGGSVLNIPSGAVVDGTGVIDYVSNGVGTPLTLQTGTGRLEMHTSTISSPTLSTAGSPRVLYADGQTLTSGREMWRNEPETFVQHYTSTNGFYGGLGFDLYFDGTNWKTVTDGGNNAGSGMYATVFGGWDFFYLPSTGGTQQTVAPASITTYKVAHIDNTGITAAHFATTVANATNTGLNADEVDGLHAASFDLASIWRSGRVLSCTTAASANATCTTSWSVSPAYADAAYTPSCTTDRSTGSAFVVDVSSKATGSFSVTIMNAPGSTAASQVFIDCNVRHD